MEAGVQGGVQAMGVQEEVRDVVAGVQGDVWAMGVQGAVGDVVAGVQGRWGPRGGPIEFLRSLHSTFPPAVPRVRLSTSFA